MWEGGGRHHTIGVCLTIPDILMTNSLQHYSDIKMVKIWDGKLIAGGGALTK